MREGLDIDYDLDVVHYFQSVVIIREALKNSASVSVHTHTRRKILKKAHQGARGADRGGDIKLCAKFHNPRTAPSKRKVCGSEN